MKEIPQNEVHNVIAVYWEMMRRLEDRTEITKDPLDIALVEGAYNVLNRIELTKGRPVWEKST